jgi:FkbM family methyltransferase
MPEADAVRVPGAEDAVDVEVRQRFFPEQHSGVLVEVGAAHPDYLSMGASYRDLGWTVIAVEPNPEFCALHRAQGHEILEYACGDHDEDGVEFSVASSHGASYRGGEVSYEAFSSLQIKDSYARLLDDSVTIRKITVDLRRLDTLLRQHAPEVGHIDIVAVDTEGWELEVIAGLDLARYAPRVLIIENLFADPQYRAYMRRRGYELWKYVTPNDIYIPASELRPADRLRREASRAATFGRGIASRVRGRLGRSPEVA